MEGAVIVIVLVTKRKKKENHRESTVRAGVGRRGGVDDDVVRQLVVGEIST